MSLVGDLLDNRYRVGHVLDRTEFLITYAATDTKLERNIVIKVLAQRWADNLAVRDSLVRNAEAAARMVSDRIIRGYDNGVGQFDTTTGEKYDSPYLVMEKATGTSLQQAIDTSTLSLLDAKQITKQLLDTLESAHRMGLHHGNINTHTVTLTAEKEIKLDDFALALALRETELQQQDLGALLGDQSAISPEYLSIDKSDNRTDLYSVSAVYYAMLTSKAPFAGTDEQVVSLQQSAVPERPTTLNPFVSETTSDTTLEGLAGRLDNGFQSAADFAAALDQKPRVQQHRATTSEVLSPLRGEELDRHSTTSLADIEAATDGTTSTLTSEIPLLDSTTTQQSNAWKRLAFIGVGVVILAGLVWLILALTSTAPKSSSTVSVADLTGLSQAEAISQLKAQGLTASISPVKSDDVEVGKVVATSPTKGIVVERGTEVEIEVSAGKDPVEIPDLTGKDEAAAKEAITKANLKVGEITQVESSSVASGYVVSSDPEEGESVAPESTIDISISNGKVVVPKVTGKKYAKAVQILQSDLGLIVNPVPDYQCKGKQGIVTSQSIKPGKTKQGSAITIKYRVRGASCG